MVQELLDMNTGRVYRRVGGGEWEEQFVDTGGKVASLLANAPYVRSSGSTIIYRGTNVVTISNSSAILMTDASVRSIIGRKIDNTRDVVLAASGDSASSAGWCLLNTVISANDGNIIVLTARQSGAEAQSSMSGTARVNWAIVAG